MCSDFLLIKRMRQGEESAFDLFVRKYYKEILAYCGYRCPGKECAEDIAQETFVRFFAKLSNYRHRGKAKNYLYTIAGNLCRDYFKKIKEIPVEEVELSAQTEFAVYPMDQVLDRITVEWAVKQLPDELREVTILYYFQELRHAEIADILQISVSSVKYRLKQAKLQLGKLFRKGEEDGSGKTTYDL